MADAAGLAPQRHAQFHGPRFAVCRGVHVVFLPVFIHQRHADGHALFRHVHRNGNVSRVAPPVISADGHIHHAAGQNLGKFVDGLSQHHTVLSGAVYVLITDVAACQPDGSHPSTASSSRWPTSSGTTTRPPDTVSETAAPGSAFSPASGLCASTTPRSFSLGTIST